MKELVLTYQKETITYPNWDDVKMKLDKTISSSGNLSLEIKFLNESGYIETDESLSLTFENGKYLILYSDPTQDEWTIYGYENINYIGDEVGVDIMGEIWHPSTICYNLSFVIGIFKEFFYTRKINPKSLQDRGFS